MIETVEYQFLTDNQTAILVPQQAIDVTGAALDRIIKITGGVPIKDLRFLNHYMVQINSWPFMRSGLAFHASKAYIKGVIMRELSHDLICIDVAEQIFNNSGEDLSEQFEAGKNSRVAYWGSVELALKDRNQDF